MKIYNVHLTLTCDYQVEAETEQEALAKADEWFAECVPHATISEVEEQEE